MPFKSEKIKLPEKYDRRRKLTNDQKDEIRKKYESGFGSLQSLANEYGVSKKTILLTVNPKSKEKNDKRIKDHWKEYQASKNERNKIMRDHRQYKQELYMSGKIK
jgi:DNA invertase Pin-like site-specific DNA recombinase